jgi:hypothetical protein
MAGGEAGRAAQFTWAHFLPAALSWAGEEGGPPVPLLPGLGGGLSANPTLNFRNLATSSPIFLAFRSCLVKSRLGIEK